MVPALCPRRAGQWVLPVPLLSGRWGRGVGRRARSRQPPPSHHAKDPRLCWRCHHASWLLGAGGSLTRGWAKGSDAVGPGRAGGNRLPPSWQQAPALPTAGGTKGIFTHPCSARGPTLTPWQVPGLGSQWGRTDWVPMRGLGAAPSTVPLMGAGVPQLGVASSHPCGRHLHTPQAPRLPSWHLHHLISGSKFSCASCLTGQGTCTLVTPHSTSEACLGVPSSQAAQEGGGTAKVGSPAGG